LVGKNEIQQTTTTTTTTTTTKYKYKTNKQTTTKPNLLGFRICFDETFNILLYGLHIFHKTIHTKSKFSTEKFTQMKEDVN